MENRSRVFYVQPSLTATETLSGQALISGGSALLPCLGYLRRPWDHTLVTMRPRQWPHRYEGPQAMDRNLDCIPVLWEALEGLRKTDWKLDLEHQLSVSVCVSQEFRIYLERQNLCKTRFAVEFLMNSFSKQPYELSRTEKEMKIIYTSPSLTLGWFFCLHDCFEYSYWFVRKPILFGPRPRLSYSQAPPQAASLPRIYFYHFTHLMLWVLITMNSLWSETMLLYSFVS